MTKESTATRVMIVDDHPTIRDGLAMHIAAQPDMEVCGQANDEAEALRLLEAARPDVMIVDIQLETGNGLDLVQRITARDESIGILVWSTYPDNVYARRAIGAGALGYIDKRHAASQIVDAIRRVREGRIYLSEETAEQLLSTAIGRGGQVKASGVECLSDRELEVFRLIGEGTHHFAGGPASASSRSSVADLPPIGGSRNLRVESRGFRDLCGGILVRSLREQV
jgi:DNA-binding NarL/FixJ family response regulator